MFGRDRGKDPAEMTASERIAQLVETQQEEVVHLRSLANWLSRLSGLLVVLGMISGVAIMVQERQHACTDLLGQNTCAASAPSHPYVVAGLVIMASSLFWALVIALAGSWARSYATARLLDVECILNDLAVR